MTVPLRFDAVRVNDAGTETLTCEIPAHQVVSIVGNADSGVGEVGRLALGLRPAPPGRVTLLQTDPATLSRPALLAARRRVGYLPAGNGLLQNLSLADNIALPMRFGSDRPDAEIDSRLRVMLAAVRLTAAATLRPARASEEQRRRAALARALAFDPPLVILEEPFVGLTDQAARGVLELARGGDVPGGSRRTVLTLGPNLPPSVWSRFDVRYRMRRGGVSAD